jgi:G3E family GTPase
MIFLTAGWTAGGVFTDGGHKPAIRPSKLQGAPMKLKQLCPDGFLAAGAEGMQAFLRTVLVRTNFVPGVRHVIGWRGLKETVTSVEGWSAKIRDQRGVFGIYLDAFEQSKEWLTGKFNLLYFPDPQEELVERCSLQASAYTQREDYREHVRDFLRKPELCELFPVGIIELGINQTEHAIFVGLESVSHQRSIAQDGVSVYHEGQLVELIRPGGYDQNFPAHDTAMAFYHVLAASLTFNLEEPPVYMRRFSRRGRSIAYDNAGRHWEHPADNVFVRSVYLGYGPADFEGILDKRKAEGERCPTGSIWVPGKVVPPEFVNARWWHAHQISDYHTLDKKILGVDDRPQLIVLTGFLGSGKTSFLQHFIEYQVQKSRFVAVVQNEIGEVGLDGKLLESDYAVTEIDEGCICCSLVGNLNKAIRQILSSFHPDFIILETTGLANPYNLLDEIAAMEELVKFDCVATLVDGANLSTVAARYEVVKNQVRAADILLVNKKDLFGPKKLKEVEKALRMLNQSAPIITCRNGDVNPSLLFGSDHLDKEENNCQASVRREPGTSCSTHALEGITSMKVKLPCPLRKEQFLRLVESMPESVFRMKGIIDFFDHPTSLVFQYVAGRYEFSEFRNPVITDRFLVIIGQNLPQDDIREMLNKSNGQVASPSLSAVS